MQQEYKDECIRREAEAKAEFDREYSHLSLEEISQMKKENHRKCAEVLAKYPPREDPFVVADVLTKYPPKEDPFVAIRDHQREDNSQQKENWDYSLRHVRDQFRARLAKHLPPDEQEATIGSWWKHRPCIPTNYMELGQSPWIRRTIDMGDANPINQMPYESAFKKRKVIEFTVERNDHVLAEKLNMYVSSDRRDWDIFLAFAISVINSTANKSTDYKPFALIYGREARLPMDLEHQLSVDLVISGGDSSLPHAEWIKKYLQRAYGIVRQQMTIVKAKQKKDAEIFNLKKGI